jgi:hypothetical protein
MPNHQTPTQLPPPRMKTSTKMALAIMAGMVVAGAYVPWAPPPSGWVLLGVVVYVGLPLLVMVFHDLSELRQARMLVRHLDAYGEIGQDPEAWLDVKYEPLASEHIARWRRWFPWLLGILAVMVLAALLGAPRFVLIILAVIAFGREFFLAVNVIEWLVPANWSELTTSEQLRLRLNYLTFGLAMATIASGVVAIAIYLFFISDETLSWRHFAFAGFYGLLVWPCGRAAIRLLHQAVRRRPAEDRPAERPV